MNKTSILALINSSEIPTKDELIKKILIFIETEFEVMVSFLEYEELFPILYYLNDDMIVQSYQYKVLLEKSDKLEIIIDISPFQENSYFNKTFTYAKVPIKVSDKQIGEVIFKVDNIEEFSKNKDLINRLALEIAFLLDYYELKLMKDDAVESLIKETQITQKQEEILKNIKDANHFLKNQSDFGVLIIDLELNVIETNDYLKNILGIVNKKSNITNFLTQNEISNHNFINYLKKLNINEKNSITNVSFISINGKELNFKVSGNILKSSGYFFLKLFNITSEIVITKKFANLKSKFDQLLKIEIGETIKTSDLVMLETLKFFENKDEDFGNHLERIAAYSFIIAEYIFNNNLNEDIDLDYLRVFPRAASLHDIGMLSIKESILFKDSKFTKEEFLTVKNHTIIAANMIAKLIKQYPNSIFLRLLKEITLGHHERYNGEGYPYGLKGKQIPLSARIVALADIFDGLTTDRIYKKGLDLDIARMMIVDYKGKLLDPDIVGIYLKNEESFIKIHKKYKLL